MRAVDDEAGSRVRLASVRRGWLIAAVVVALAAVVAAVAAARLTDDDDGLDAWAGSVCTSLSDWHASMTALTDLSAGDLNRESLEERLDVAGSATGELVSELRQLGAPELETGDELRRRLEATVDSLRSSFDSLRIGAQEALAADSPVALLRALAALAPAFQELLDAAAGTLDALEAADLADDARVELQQAFGDAEPCRALRGED